MSGIDRIHHQHGDRLGDRDNINLLLAVVYDFASGDDGEALVDFLRHIDFDIRAISAPMDLVQALPAHYRVRQGVYHVGRLERDMETWGPIADRIARMRKARAQGENSGVLPDDL